MWGTHTCFSVTGKIALECRKRSGPPAHLRLSRIIPELSKLWRHFVHRASAVGTAFLSGPE